MPKTIGDVIDLHANRNALEPRIVSALIVAESNGNPRARRYEKRFFERYLKGLTKEQLTGHVSKTLSLDTEMHDRATSWGAMQVMGETARSIGNFHNDDLADLLFPEVGIPMGCVIFAHYMKRANRDIRQALLFYNGGGNESYPDRVLGFLGSERALRIQTMPLR